LAVRADARRVLPDRWGPDRDVVNLSVAAADSRKHVVVAAALGTLPNAGQAKPKSLAAGWVQIDLASQALLVFGVLFLLSSYQTVDAVREV